MDKLGGILIMLSVLAAELAWYHRREGDPRKGKALKWISIAGFILGVVILVMFAVMYHGQIETMARGTMVLSAKMEM